MNVAQIESVRLGVLMDPIETLNIKKDTSLALIEAAQNRGWEIYYFQQIDMRLEHGLVKARVQKLVIDLTETKWFELSAPEDMELKTLNVLMMRKDPPFDMDYIYSTYLLERAEQEGVLVVNSPGSLRDCNEKLFATEFPQCCPPLMVSANSDELKRFHLEHKDVIYKPLDGMGGSSIFRAREDEHNLSVILETLTSHGKHPIMAQTYLPEIKDGDKRILMIDGDPIPYSLARIPSQGETRGNLAAGGRGEVRTLSERDLWIANQIGPALRERGLIFVGLDVIGDYLTEINVTSPTCVREIDRGANTDIGDKLVEAISQRLKIQ
jgi:glutathione synthase